MVSIIIELGDFGPEACIRGLGQVNLSDFYLCGSEQAKYRVEKLYRSDLQALYTKREMDEEDVEMIKQFALNRKEISSIQIDEFQKGLSRKYSLSIPKEAKV